MKIKLFLAILFTMIIFSSSCQQLEVVADSTNSPVLEWEHNSFSFGDLFQGAKVSHEFKFKNKGNVPLIISNVLVTCGCTVPEWPKEPILPKKSGVIRIFFNTAGKTGHISKTVTILTNTKTGRETAMFTANVLVPVK